MEEDFKTRLKARLQKKQDVAPVTEIKKESEVYSDTVKEEDIANQTFEQYTEELPDTESLLLGNAQEISAKTISYDDLKGIISNWALKSGLPLNTIVQILNESGEVLTAVNVEGEQKSKRPNHGITKFLSTLLSDGKSYSMDEILNKVVAKFPHITPGLINKYLYKTEALGFKVNRSGNMFTKAE